MASSTTPPRSTFVWVWLPDATVPVVAGRLIAANDDRYVFAYGQSYLARPDANPARTE